MYTIFKPLDAEERLPREQLLAAKRFRSVGRWELAGAVWLPSLVVIMVLGQWAERAGADGARCGRVDVSRPAGVRAGRRPPHSPEIALSPPA